MATSDNSGAFLEDLANEILLSLPVKSLLRFKCVCKKWCALIEDPKFTIEHLICSKKKPPQFLIYDYGAPQDAPPVTVIFDNGIPSPSQEDNSQRFGAIKTLLGSVDGLFFLEREIDNGLDKGSLCSLWNPATREVRHLPAATIEFQPFDDSGRHFGDCERNVLYNNTYLNGSYYWLLTEDRTWKIISFDFGKEMFVKIKGPPDDYYIDVWSANLILFDDSVAILNFLEGRVIDVWVMIHPGVWNKFVTFNWFEPIEICYESSLILVTKDSRLLFYNVKTKKKKLLEFRLPGTSSTDPEIGGCGIYYYKESLVTIKRQGNCKLDLNDCLTKMVAGY
ncbi:hypothetical protein CQW23_32674 [Capsicum baccatum]|uniref:F-box domain-containing protein n=1 Tax=Capsicum baccatum TaxID=33114 RepID=A0A2G2V412_CAPBA|nr:hypothetical protein CQW23_32674 [Capsicum baccatum]